MCIGIEEVIFYCITGAVNYEIPECRNLFQCLNLYVHWQGRREAVQVEFLSGFTFRFQEKLMLLFVGEGHNFCLYTGTVTGTYALNLSVEKGRVRQTLAQDAVCFFIGEAGPAWQLLQMAHAVIHKGELVEIVFSVLNIHILIVHAASVDAYRRSGFHSSVCDAMSGNGFGQLVGCRFGHSSARKHGASHVHQSVQESSGSQYDAFGAESYSPKSSESGHFAVFNKNLLYGILPNMQVGSVFQNFTPCPDEFVTVALRTRTPHGRSFGAV